MNEAPAAGEGTERRRSLLQYVDIGVRGFLMGCANVVPGVSGGTMAFILGIFEELIQSIRNIGRPVFLGPLSRLRIREALGAVNFKFLLAIGIGSAAAILTLARLLEWLLERAPVLVWSFFFGLVLASVVVVAKRVRRWTPMVVTALAAGTAGAYLLVGMVPVQTPETWWFLMLSGGLAIAAMILPGISGAFVLLILGKYQYVLAAVNDRDLVVIGLLAIGAGIGLVLFAQILGWLFQHHHDLTVAVLTGLMLGSLRKIWPWKVDVEWITGSRGEVVPVVQKNVLPELMSGGSLSMELVYAVVLALAGLVFVILLERWGEMEDTEHEPT